MVARIPHHVNGCIAPGSITTTAQPDDTGKVSDPIPRRKPCTRKSAVNLSADYGNGTASDSSDDEKTSDVEHKPGISTTLNSSQGRETDQDARNGNKARIRTESDVSDGSPVLPPMLNGDSPSPIQASRSLRGNASESHDSDSWNATDEVVNHPFWLQTDAPSRVVCIPSWVSQIVSEGNEMLVLAQINYWFRCRKENNMLRAHVERDGHIWLVKTCSDLGREIGRNKRQVKKAVARLKVRGFIVVERHRSQFYNSKVVMHVRIDWDRVGAKSEEVEQKQVEGVNDENMS